MQKVATLNIVKIKTLYTMLQTSFKNMFFWLRYFSIVLIPFFIVFEFVSWFSDLIKTFFCLNHVNSMKKRSTGCESLLACING